MSVNIQGLDKKIMDQDPGLECIGRKVIDKRLVKEKNNSNLGQSRVIQKSQWLEQIVRYPSESKFHIV